MNKEIWQNIMGLIDKTSHLQVKQKNIDRPNRELFQILKNDPLPTDLHEFYTTIDSFTLRWQTKDGNQEGSIHFLPLKHYFDDTSIRIKDQDIQWYVDDRPVPLDAVYHPIDMFTDEASVGLFEGYGDVNKLYLYESGASFYSLQLGLFGYLQLLQETYGFFYWPRMLVAIQGIAFQDMLDYFRSDLKQINPRFDYEDFKALYQNLQTDTL